MKTLQPERNRMQYPIRNIVYNHSTLHDNITVFRNCIPDRFLEQFTGFQSVKCRIGLLKTFRRRPECGVQKTPGSQHPISRECVTGTALMHSHYHVEDWLIRRSDVMWYVIDTAALPKQPPHKFLPLQTKSPTHDTARRHRLWFAFRTLITAACSLCRLWRVHLLSCSAAQKSRDFKIIHISKLNRLYWTPL